MLPMVVPILIREPAKPTRELGLGGRSGNPGPSGPPAGVTGAGGGAGQVTDPEQGPSAAGGIGHGTGPNQGAGLVQGQGAGSGKGQPRGRGRSGTISVERLKEFALLYGEGKPFRDVPINSKEKAAKDNLKKVKPSKEKPGKGKPDADPSATDTGSKGKPVFVSGVKPKEYKADSNSNTVDDEVANALVSLEKKIDS